MVHSVDTMLSLAPEPRRQLGLELVDLLSSLQEVDIDAVGLSPLRRSEPYLERQMHRWKSQGAQSPVSFPSWMP